MSSSFLCEIFDEEENDLGNISECISRLVDHTSILKRDVSTLIDNQSLKFNPMLKENLRLKFVGEKLLKEMGSVEDLIEKDIKEELASCTVELDGLSYTLKEINLLLNILTELIDIDSSLRKAKKKIANGEYHEGAQLVKCLQDAVKKNYDRFKDIEVFKVLVQEVTLTYELLLYRISEVWSDCIKITVTDKKENTKHLTLLIKTKAADDLSQILKASNHLNSHSNEKKFSKIFLNDILNPLIIFKSSIIEETNHTSFLLSIQIFEGTGKPNYTKVFENIKMAINFLKNHLSLQISDGQTFLSLMGSFIATDFADSLIKNYLSEAIPNNSKDFENYKEIVSNASELEQCLQSIDFLPKDSSTLMEYARNVNALFANKFCQSFLSKARDLMKKDLHNVTQSEEVVSNVGVLPRTQKDTLKNKMNLQEDVFTFSKCQISKHAKEIIDLVNTMIAEMKKSTELCAIRLFYSIRNIFEMYCAVVPLHHKKFLETLPQQVALFHNNCLYFAHNLIHMATELKDDVPNFLKSYFPIFLEQAVYLRSLAAEKLESCVTNQRNQLIYILRDSGLAALNDNPKLDPSSEKSLRQCMRQLQILQKIWLDVLPLAVYNRAVGFLIDAIIEEIISLIVSVEDISSQTASELVSSFDVLSEKILVLFPEEKEIYRHVRKWQKFKEFILVLKGSLRDIDDRWANGMGPLALEFTPDQVKHMIRALFQNSDRRAALLARIR